jgi:hypothetical protein
MGKEIQYQQPTLSAGLGFKNKAQSKYYITGYFNGTADFGKCK